MNIPEAHQLALGYAWGTEDHSDIKTAVPSGALIGPLEFATAFAQGWDDYNTERRCNMVPVKDAYEHWQASQGKTVFREGDSTEEQRARHDAFRKQHARNNW